MPRVARLNSCTMRAALLMASGERISQLMENVTEEVKRQVDELSNPHGGDSGTPPGQEGDALA